MKRHTRRLLAALAVVLAMTTLAPSTLAQEGVNPAASVFAIDDSDPVGSVPSPALAQRQPLEMGYFVMELSRRAESARQAGEHKRAAQYFRALAKAVPDRATAFSKACQAHADDGDWVAALEVCRVALGADGVTVADLVRFVNVMLKQPGKLTSHDAVELDEVLARLRDVAPSTEMARVQLSDLECQVAVRLEDVARLRACATPVLKRINANTLAEHVPAFVWIAGAALLALLGFGVVRLARYRSQASAHSK